MVSRLVPAKEKVRLKLASWFDNDSTVADVPPKTMFDVEPVTGNVKDTGSVCDGLGEQTPIASVPMTSDVPVTVPSAPGCTFIVTVSCKLLALPHGCPTKQVRFGWKVSAWKGHMEGSCLTVGRTNDADTSPVST